MLARLAKPVLATPPTEKFPPIVQLEPATTSVTPFGWSVRLRVAPLPMVTLPSFVTVAAEIELPLPVKSRMPDAPMVSPLVMARVCVVCRHPSAQNYT